MVKGGGKENVLWTIRGLGGEGMIVGRKMAGNKSNSDLTQFVHTG